MRTARRPGATPPRRGDGRDAGAARGQPVPQGPGRRRARDEQREARAERRYRPPTAPPAPANGSSRPAGLSPWRTWLLQAGERRLVVPFPDAKYQMHMSNVIPPGQLNYVILGVYIGKSLNFSYSNIVQKYLPDGTLWICRYPRKKL
ncbi:tumor necrosis factor receptor superfamily member 17 isoform X3 [Rhea pennata]|uniref:tumor necrosis factor receptor superfamily member 17 isoform X3 n=2 Tax=Rhea pennata TaxID=8795 RepID=UPI002E27281B